MPADQTPIQGCAHTPLERSDDDRGRFVKVYQRSVADAMGYRDMVAEFYYSCSSRGVIRGLHFQSPPYHHAKIVVCVVGSMFDVVVDLRVGSPTYAEHVTYSLDGAAPSVVHVPAGCAHGFQALADDTLVGYLVSTEHELSHDSGIRWDSAGVEWPLPGPVVSARDRSLPTLNDLVSPFRYEPARG
ncbi:MAG TPA: dTDP-4-dehydrorhamnose 3,5-epimerase family protein [Acidimicrobiia bacterium]|nr:dTDP-4-dehydrorhamnose 3,5-epimerase family protein [Acidimicrobiia bacterium]